MSTDTERDEYLSVCDQIEELEYEIREKEEKLDRLKEEKERWERQLYPRATHWST
jgi:wobble nucleotide-excising tRNase